MPTKTKNTKFWSVKAEKSAGGATVGNLYLYGVISATTWWGDEITPQMFREDIQALGEIAVLNVHIFSDGGDVFAGNAIYSILKQHPATVNAYVEGIAASIATIVMMAADNIYVSRAANLLVHNPMFGLFGYYNKLEMEAMIQDLAKYSEPMIATYQSRTGMSREEVIAMMDGKDKAGTWYTAQEAIDSGLADDFIPEEGEEVLDAVACIGPDAYQWKGYTFDLSAYPNAPQITNRRYTNMARTKKTVKASRARNVRAEMITVICPECGATIEVETDPIPGDPSEDLEARHRVAAETHSITCPICNVTFSWSTESEPPAPGEADPPEVTEARSRGRIKAKAVKSLKAEIINITCPECGNVFELDTEPVAPSEGDAIARGRGRVAAEVYSVTCPECGHIFEWDADIAGPADEPEASGPISYKAGVIAERRRIAALDTIAHADPASAEIVATAKNCGWSYEKTCKAVFDEMAARGPADPAATYMAARTGEVQNSGSARVRVTPNSGAAGSAGKTAQSQAVSAIVAGMTKKKARR